MQPSIPFLAESELFQDPPETESVTGAPGNTESVTGTPGQEGEGQAPQPSPPSWIPFILIGVVLWLFLFAPARKDKKRREAMLANLEKGDKVMTSSGIYGAVTKVEDAVVTLQVADGVRIKFSRPAIQGLIEDKPSKENGDS